MRRLLVVVTVVLSGLIGLAAPALAAPPTLVLDSLTVPASAAVGQTVTASARVRAVGGPVALQSLTIAVRSTAGDILDFPGARAVTVPTAGLTYTANPRSFAVGTYDVFVAVQSGGVWRDLTPHKTLTVTDANPVTFFQDFTGPAGANANYGLSSPLWSTDVCWTDSPSCSGSLAQYKDDHARLDGAGSLVLTADRAVDPGAVCPPVRCTFASARLTTVRMDGANRGLQLWSQAGGHYEARIKMPTGRGLWPAFWLLGDEYNGDWPLTGEIDIMETLGHQPTLIQQHLHGGQPDVNLGAGYPLPSGDITGWHTYAVDWDAAVNGHVTWSVDGVVTRQITAADAGSAWTSLRGKEALVLDLAVGGDWPGAPDASTVFPARMYIDYIKVNKNPVN